MGKWRHAGLAGYGAAIALMALAMAVERLLSPLVEPNICPPFLAAVMVSAWYGGLGPGILVSLIAFSLLPWLDSTHLGDPHPELFHSESLLRLATYAMTAILIGFLSSSRRRAHRVLRDGQELFEAVLQQMPAGVIIAEAPDGRIIFSNQRAAAICHRTNAVGGPEHYAHLPAWRADGRPYDPEDHPLTRSLKSGEVISGEQMELLCDDGERVVVAVNACPIHNREGQLMASVIAFQDITRQKQAQDAREFISRVSDTLAESLDYPTTLQRVVNLAVPRLASVCSVQMLDSHGRLNRIASAIDGQPTRDRVCQFMDRFPPNPQDSRCALGEVLRTGRSVLVPIVDEQWMQARASSEDYFVALREIAPASYMCVPLSVLDRVLGAISFFSIDPGRRFTPADLELAEELARRAALAVDHARLYREAQDALAAKDQFLAMLSHEIRTPLGPVLMGVSMLQRQDLPAAALESLLTIRRNVELEVRLIDDLLDLSRINAGKFSLVPEIIDVHTAMCSALQLCQPDIDARKLRVTVEFRANRRHCHADPTRLRQVFWNLLKNAVKFTPAEGCITVRAWNEPADEHPARAATNADPGAPSPAQIVMEISDTGIGIPPDRLQTLFQPFEQGGRDITRRFGGLGLGLTISRAIIEAHGGTISASSSGEGKGSTFTVRLPAAAQQPKPEPAEIAPADLGLSDGMVRSVLLVEDHADTSRMMASLLKTYNFHVTTAATLAEARDAATAREFDLLISDMGLPDGCGVDLLRDLHQRRMIPAICVSGYGMEADIQRTRDAGFIDHLIKPIDLPKLEAALRRAVERIDKSVTASQGTKPSNMNA